MIRGKAILSAVVFTAILVASTYGLLLNDGTPSGTRYEAEFIDAGSLWPGDDVREFGGVVGSVDTMRLTDRGTALVTFTVAGVPAPRADASASVASADLLGTTYLDLSPGHAAAPLRTPIPTSRTFLATRLDDFLNTFRPSTRMALKLLLVELGQTLDARGEDLNGAALALAPALGEVSAVAEQLGAQDAHLSDLVVNAQRLTGQVAPHAHRLGQLIDGLQRTLTRTAASAGSIERGLSLLPPTLGQADVTLARLGAAAVTGIPLARELDATAPGLTVTAQRLPPFLDDARAAVANVRPVVRSATGLLSAGQQSLPRLDATVTTLGDVTPQVAALTRLLASNAQVGVRGLFYGLGGLADEPGSQPGVNEFGRNWFRAIGLLGCESFGVRLEPGCLGKLLATFALPRTAAHAPRPEPAHKSTVPSGAAPAAQAAPIGSAGPAVPAPAPATAVVRKLATVVTTLTGTLTHTVAAPSPAAPSISGQLKSLLGYLLKP